MEKTGPYVYDNVAENKCVLIFFLGKEDVFQLPNENKMDLDREMSTAGQSGRTL